MSTDAGIMVTADSPSSARQMISTAVSRTGRIDRLMSTYRDNSDISRINARATERPVKVDKKTLHVLRASKDFYRLTDGAFDITYAPLRTLWRRASEEGKVPSDTEIKNVLRRVSSDNLILSKNSVQMAVHRMELDLGGIAKGYAVDEAVRALKETGAESALVDIGGDMRVIGRRADGEKWRVKVRDPRPGTHKPLMLRLQNAAVATSGDYARYFQIGDRRFSHIIDPRTGHPVRTVPSATVIAPTAIMADALATALSVLDPDKGLKLINSMEDVECLLMTRRQPGEPESMEMHYSNGFRARVEK
jgi:thiamine biosynthesis lipoprotein